jgi:hypothetical protein
VYVFNETRCIWSLAYVLDERGSVPITVQKTFACSIRPLSVVTPCFEFNMN